MLAYQLSAQDILYAASIPMLLAGLLIALLGSRYGVSGTVPEVAPTMNRGTEVTSTATP